MSSEANGFYSHRSPNDDHRPTSPGFNSYPASRSPAPPTSSHGDATSSRSHEHMGRPSAPVPPRTAPDSSHRRVNPSLPPDHATTSGHRQQRYNVRFVANHTPSNMTSAQRPRPSPPLATAPDSREAIDSPSPPRAEHVARPIEPAIQAITRSLQTTDESLQTERHDREQSVERCPRCYDTWNRPLPNPEEWSQDSPAENAESLWQANMNLFQRIRRHGKEADQKYEQWKEKHSHCPINGYRDRATSPEHAGVTDPSHLKAHDYASEQVSNKRKSEVPHSESSKLRKVTFDASTSTSTSIAPHVRPSAPI